MSQQRIRCARGDNKSDTQSNPKITTNSRHSLALRHQVELTRCGADTDLQRDSRMDGKKHKHSAVGDSTWLLPSVRRCDIEHCTRERVYLTSARFPQYIKARGSSQRIHIQIKSLLKKKQS